MKLVKCATGLAAALFAVSAQAVETTFDSTDIGIVRHAPGTLYSTDAEIAIGVPWMSVADSASAVAVADLITTGLSENDTLSVWNKTGKYYDVWKWNGSAWVGVNDAVHGALGDATTTTVERGQAVWYKRTNTEKTFVLIGTAGSDCTSTPTAGESDAPNYNLMCNPYPEAVDLANIAGSVGDQIVIIPDGEFITRKSDGWYKWTKTQVTNPVFGGTDYTMSEAKQDTVNLPAGRAFWYISKGGTPSINWKTIKATE